MFRKPNRSNPYTFGENDWTDLDWDKTTDYFVSKTRAEKAAWDLMESKGLKNSLTCINPGFVLGDFLNEKIVLQWNISSNCFKENFQLLQSFQ